MRTHGRLYSPTAELVSNALENYGSFGVYAKLSEIAFHDSRGGRFSFAKLPGDFKRDFRSAV